MQDFFVLVYVCEKNNSTPVKFSTENMIFFLISQVQNGNVRKRLECIFLLTLIHCNIDQWLCVEYLWRHSSILMLYTLKH